LPPDVSFLAHPSTFGAHALRGEWQVALAVVLLAGLSQTIGQCVVLFVNRVTPVRFAGSLVVGALLSAFGYAFLVLGTWATTFLPHAQHVALLPLAIAMAYAYVPLLLGFLAAMPYLGSPALSALRVWHLAALVIAYGSLTGSGALASLWHVGLGWLLLQIVERTVGQPVSTLARAVGNAVAGVSLESEGAAVVQRTLKAVKIAAKTDGAALAKRQRRWTGLLAGVAGLAAFTWLVGWLLSPLGATIFGRTVDVPGWLQPIATIAWIAVVGFVSACLLAPLETLGWWAGWYGDGIDTGDELPIAFAGTLERRADAAGAPSHWGVYLDGIAQSSSTYTPDIETFLDALVPALPRRAALVRGLMVYSVMNRPLDESAGLGMFWAFLDAVRFKHPQSIVGMIVNLRNVLVVAVSADARYGPMYNRGIAQTVYGALVAHGYDCASGTPVTLIGYSGGGQMAAAIAPLLRGVVRAPVDVVSYGGVMSGDCDFLAFDHLYHFVGRKDGVERLGTKMFASRWKIAPLSNWNRALRLGRISIVDAGPIGHQVPGGYMDPVAVLPDGRTNLAQSVAYASHVLRGQTAYLAPKLPRKESNYERYRAAETNREEAFPIIGIDDLRFRPVAPWTGRLILPERTARMGGALFEVRHAPPEHAALVGRIVPLRFVDDADVRAWVDAVTRDVAFTANASYANRYGGLVLGERLDGWPQVTPLESLAGAHPYDDIVVSLDDDTALDADGGLRTRREAVQITGSHYTVLQFLGPVGKADRYRVRFFDGTEGTVRLPQIVPDVTGICNATATGIEASPENAAGWYAYGDADAQGRFVVRALAPRALLNVVPQRALAQRDAYRYLRKTAWADAVAQKGRVATAASGTWNEGDEALLVHTYGGIGGPRGEPAAKSPIYLGHFSYGHARVVRDALSGDLRFEIRYHQVYTQNPDGLTAGALHWSRYLGDRQYGWLGVRPVCDVLLKLPSFDALPVMMRELEAMTARYRTGDGTGGTYVGIANNCAQDSNQALFDALNDSGAGTPLARDLLRALEPFGAPRDDWRARTANLGRTMEDVPWANFLQGLATWRTLIPCLAAHTISRIFLRNGADAFIMRMTQVGGDQEDIAPVIPSGI